MQQKWLYDGSFPLCRSDGESLIAKKLQKKLGFLFLRLADRRDGGGESRQGRIAHAPKSGHPSEEQQKNRPKAVSFSNIWLGQQDSRALRALSPLAQAPAGKSLKTCRRHVFFTGFHLIGSNPLHPAEQQKTARRRFRSQIYGWASRIRTYITGTKNQGPAIGRWPSVCHKAFCDYNVSGMVKPNKHPIRQNATTQYEHHLPYTGKGEPIALLVPKTLRRLRQQR